MSGDAAPPAGGNLEAALAAWRRDLGDDHVVTAAAVLDRYARSTIGRPVPAAAVLMPATQAEVVAAATTAAQRCVPRYSISRGTSRGYGAACPLPAGTVILDLRRTPRLREVDPGRAAPWRERALSTFSIRW